MCGIAGILGPEGADVSAALERLTAGLSHRGPDGTGCRYFRGRSAGLGHRRLSIVDVATGAQPMSNEDGSVWISYNGEIYNHREVRRELETRGHRFRTAADTEVVVHGWEEWGAGVFERLNGIYALALFDSREGGGNLVLARDPVGVKPLYLGRGPHGWWFASELAAARAAGVTDCAVRPEALGEYLVYRFIPSPGTIYQNTWKIPPGHYCILPSGPGAPPVFTAFTTRFAPASLPGSAEEWEAAIRDELAAAVSRQLMSDVPVGTLLSGGVDSTVITRLMQNALPGPPHAFAVGIAGEGAVNELEPARRAARELGVPLTGVEVTEEDFLAAWPAQVTGLGEPVANSGVLLVGMLCRTVGRTHKVVLSGQGADEPLGGYPRHAGERWYPVTRHLGPLLRMLPESAASSDRVDRVRRLSRERDRARRFTEILAVFPPAEISNLTGRATDPDSLAAPVRYWLAAQNVGDSLNQLLRVDARLSLADDLLLVADHMAMASSVELRVPFLDLKLLALLEAMPSRFKISPRGERKWLYRRAVRSLLPEGLREPLTGRREGGGPKLGFTAPMDRWLDRWLRDDAGQYLLGSGARLPGHIDGGAVQRVLVEAAGGRPRTRQLLSLYVLETWLRGNAA